MYYGRYSRETRRWVLSWPRPSEIIAHAKIESEVQTDESEGSVELTDDVEQVHHRQAS